MFSIARSYHKFNHNLRTQLVIYRKLLPNYSIEKWKFSSLDRF